MDISNATVYDSSSTKSDSHMVTIMNLSLIVFSVFATGTGIAACWCELLRQLRS
jgi:hypothetical protein